MGSKVITALVEQKGNRVTNPEGLVPEVSKPIQQIPSLETFPGDSNPIEQRFSAITFGGDNLQFTTSKPVEQIEGRIFPKSKIFGGDDDSIIEQRRAGTIDVVIGEPYEGPLEQTRLFPNTENLQQIETKRSLVDGTPIEQVSNKTNVVNIEQFEFIELIFPPCGSIKNPTNTNILWRIRDFGFPFDPGTLIFKVQGIEVQDSSSFTITDLGTGLELNYNPPDDFGFNTEVEIFVEIKDTASTINTFFARCSWTTVPDTRPPVIDNVVPCNQKDSVNITTPITFDVYDNGLGVDLSSITLSVEGVAVCEGLSFEPRVFPGLGNGFSVKWEDPEAPFRFGSNVTVAITASDLAEPQNSTLFICDFNTEESSPPVFQNFDPFPCESFMDTRTGLKFEVYGDLHGVDISTLEVRIDNKLKTVIVEPRILRSQ